MITIDIIVPSFRLQSEYLIPIVQMDIPSETEVRFLIVADNPDAEVPSDFQKFVDNENIILFRNKENGGSSKSRNVGLDNSNAEWVLFLDDDVKPSKDLLLIYNEAIKNKSKEVGFFGETLFPPPKTFFAKGVIACDILTFFFLAGYYHQLKWAPTSNVIIKSSAIGDCRFQEIFPKNGGGEDIDFFLKIFRESNMELQCLKNAIVYHDWWYQQKRNYTRFSRWSFGDTLLHDIFPEYTYYNFPNIIESLVFGIPISLIACFYLHSLLPLVCLFIGVIVGESLVEFIRLLIYKGLNQSKFAIEAVLIRASNDIGRLYMQLVKLKRPKGICERFDHFCDGKHIKYQRLWAGIKFSTYLIISVGLYFIARHYLN
jgi:glycosyltransferase involved in cell wall biosynthesis